MTTGATPPLSRRYRFDRFELRPAERELRADGQLVNLGSRAFDMLVALVERSDRVVGKGDLMDLVWPKLVVEENNLQVQVMALRKVLGSNAIVTIPGRGYRFALSVRAEGAPTVATSAEPPPIAVQAGGTLPSGRSNLPRCVEALIGRDRELAHVQALLADCRLVTVTGPGGVGKSRLVIDAAWACFGRFADGIWFVELAALADPALVPSTISTALGITVVPPADPLRTLTRQLGDRSLLLVLDNCEHVVEAVASVLEAVLAAAPNMRALVSSQELIGIAGEHVLRVPSLAIPGQPNPTAEAARAAGAVQLFVARAQASDPRFVFDDGAAPVVTAICRRLDGVPLALEMAAARVPLLGIEGLASRLDERFRVLTAGRRTALPRQRTLQATLDWSYGLLSPSEQAVLRQLSVFAGTFSLAAAAAVASRGEDDEFGVIECLAGLCDKSLVVADTSNGEVRYRLLETTRAYAQERLAEASETVGTTRRHALFYRRRVEACFDDWTLLSDAAFRARYAPEIDNLRGATAWALGPDGESDTAIALVGSSMQVWVSLSLYAEADALVQRALERLASSTSAVLEADLWSALASLSATRDQQTSIRAARRAADLYRSLGNSLRLGCALQALGSAHAYSADEETESLLAEARAMLAATGRPRLRAMYHGACGLLHSVRGNPDDGTRELRAALELYRAAGAEAAELRTLNGLADQAWMQGDVDLAMHLVKDLLERHGRSPFSDRVSRAYASANLFGMLVEHGEITEAQGLGRQMLPELCELGIAASWLDHYAHCLARAGDVETAIRVVGWADALLLAKGQKRQPNEQRARDATFAIVRASGLVGDLAQLLAEGAAWREEEAYLLALPKGR